MTPTSGASTPRLALIAAGVSVVLWASAYVGIRDVADTFSPGPIALGRLFVGSIALGVPLLTRGWVRVSRRDFGFIVAAGLLWFGAYNVALNEAERHVDAGTASMLVNTGPIFLGIFAGIFLHEGMPGRLLVGLAIAFAGSVVVGFALSSDTAGSTNSIVGIALCLVAAVVYAAGVTLEKPVLKTVPALQLTWMACTVAFLACLPFTGELLTQAQAAPIGKLGWLAYLGIFPTAIGFTTWAYALNRTNTGRLGATTYLVPPVVIAMAWVLLGEVPPVLAIVGGFICIAGVVVVRTPNLGRLRGRGGDRTAVEPEAIEA
jgi:drug/metabolite transporter (DMT)-like permease